MSRIPEVLRKHEDELVREWMQQQLNSVARRKELISEAELRQQSMEFLNLLQQAAQDGNFADIQSASYRPVRDMLSELSRSRARQGFTPSETATFVFSFKQPLFARLRAEFGKDPQALADETWAATQLLDQLGLFTTESYLKTRQEIILRQQQDMLELSTPVVKLWEGIVALPLIGTLDSARTQVVMEALLQRIVETGSQLAIIDITGVPTVDTLVAQHLLKTVTAARLMGAECIISGFRPQIAQTIVHLGVNLAEVVTKANLSDALALAMAKLGLSVHRTKKNADKSEA